MSTQDKLSITIVCDNKVEKRKLLAEHGLSMFIEIGDQRVLFDTGQGFTIKCNARRLNVPLDRLTACIISHGHYDHTSGLTYVLQEAGSLKIYGHSKMFKKRFSRNSRGDLFEVGILDSKSDLEKMKGTFEFIDKPAEVWKNLYITGEVPRVTDFEKPSSNLLVETEKGLITDPICDDQSLVINSKRGLVIILGCCHSGLINTLRHVHGFMGKKKIHAIIGGMHLADISVEQLRKTIAKLKNYDFDYIMPLHCSGFAASCELYKEFGSRYIDGGVGDRVVL